MLLCVHELPEALGVLQKTLYSCISWHFTCVFPSIFMRVFHDTLRVYFLALSCVYFLVLLCVYFMTLLCVYFLTLWCVNGLSILCLFIVYHYRNMSEESSRPSVNGALTYLSLLRQTERNSLQSLFFSPPPKKESRQWSLTFVLPVALAKIEDTIEGLMSCLMNVIVFGCLLAMANSAALALTLSFTTQYPLPLSWIALICSMKEATDSLAVSCLAFWNRMANCF